METRSRPAVSRAVVGGAIAGLIGGGTPVSDTPKMVGWGTFSIEHALYGLVVGLWPALRPQDVSLRTERPRLVSTEAGPGAA